jgi:hypothetical protein
VRRAALDRFGERAIKTGAPMATLEEVLVPLYLHHRYQIESAATAMGGVGYVYAARGDGQRPMWRVPADEQRRALDALMRVLAPSELALPRPVLDLIPPRPPGWGMTRELFPRYTGGAFDALTPAATLVAHTLDALLAHDRAARLVEQNVLDPALPGLGDVLNRLVDATFNATTSGPYEEEIARTAERVLVDELVELATQAPMPQVRAYAMGVLRTLSVALSTAPDPLRQLMGMQLEQILEHTVEPVPTPTLPPAPPGAPIGDPAPEWVWR